MRRLRSAAASLYRSIVEMDTIDLVTRLPLLMLLFSSAAGAEWQLKAPLQLLAVAGLLVPGLHRSSTLWALLAAAVGAKTLLYWWIQDNHMFLFTYWFLALALALPLAQPVKALATSSRLLIGLSFAFAVLWKGILSPEFLDGSYFHYTFLTDRRFEDFAYLLGGLREGSIHSNHQAMAELGRQAAESVRLEAPAQLVVLARLSVWWTLAIEVAAAVAFLWPVGRGPSKVRHALLILFAFTTYLTVDVSTFGWTLLTLGLAQCEPELHRTRFLYVLGCFVVLVYHYVPLLSFLRPLIPG